MPNVPLCFWTFRVMIGMGCLCMLLFVVALWLWRKQRLDRYRWFYWLSFACLPAVYLAGQCGWVLAEVGRQPWAIQDLLPVGAAVSSLSAGSVITTFILFAVLFTALMVAEVSIMCNAIKSHRQ